MLCGESVIVFEVTVQVWYDRIKDFLIGYSAKDAWNADEPSSFYRVLPENILAAQCKGGKISINRLSILFFANADGGKEPPIVIGRSELPRYFKSL